MLLNENENSPEAAKASRLFSFSARDGMWIKEANCNSAGAYTPCVVLFTAISLFRRNEALSSTAWAALP